MTPDEERAQQLFLRYVMPELASLAKRVGVFATERQRTKDEIEAWLIAEMRKALDIGRARVEASGQVVPGSRLDALLCEGLDALGKQWAGATLSRLH